jgi:uncharacterized protein
MLLWNGDEVKATISDIVMRDNAGGIADSMMIFFPDPEKAYLNWKPQKGDIISASVGGWSSGDMYFDGYAAIGKSFNAMAISTPPIGKSETHRVWDNVEFLHIASDIAAACGLGLVLHDIPNYRYDVVSQLGEANLGFLNRLCEREGWSLKVHNRKIVIFNEKVFESKPSELTIDRAAMAGDYEFGSIAAGLKSACSAHFYGADGLISYTHNAPGIFGGSIRLDGRSASVGEAQRFTKAALRLANKNESSGRFTLPLNTAISAGNTFNLTGMGAFNGLWYLTRVEQHLISKLTGCRCRRPIEGDY